MPQVGHGGVGKGPDPGPGRSIFLASACVRVILHHWAAVVARFTGRINLARH